MSKWCTYVLPQLRRVATAALMVVAMLGGRAAAQSAACDSAALPYLDNFDAYTSHLQAMPPCWTALRNYDLGMPPHLEQDADGNTVLMMLPGSLSGSHYSMAIGPAIAGANNMQGLHLSLRLRSASTAARLIIGFCTDTGRYTHAFTAIDTVHAEQSGRWQNIALNLNTYQSPGRRIALRMERGLQPDGTAIEVDDLRLSPCGVADLAASHVATDKLTLHFQPFGVGEVQVSYADELITAAVSPLTISGLQADSLYTFTIGCPDGLQQQLSVHTFESEGFVPAYAPTFSPTALPPRWRHPSGGAPQLAQDKLNMPTADSCMLVLPRLNAATINELTLAVNIGGNATLQVGAMSYAEEPSTFELIGSLQGEGQRLLSLSAYEGEARYLALRAVGNESLSISGLRIGRCLTGTPRAYNLTDSGVQLLWDTLLLAPEAHLYIEYGPQGFTPGNGEATLTADASPIAISGLQPSTAYDAILLNSCGDEPCEADRTSFSTFAHEVLPPYCTDFELGSTLPQGWVASSGAVVTVQTDSYSGSRALQINGGSVALPLIGEEAADSIILQFYAHGSGTLNVGLAATPFAEVQSIGTIEPTTYWALHTIILRGAAGLCPRLSTEGQWTIDALSLRVEAITTASASGESTDSVLLSWRGVDSVAIEYRLGTADFAPGLGTQLRGGGGTAVLRGLQAGKTYGVHLSPLGAEECLPTNLSFQTLAEAQALPFCANFESEATGSLPTGWRRASSAGEYPIVNSERKHGGSHAMLMMAEGTGTTLAIMPDVTACADSTNMELWVLTASAAAILEVGYITDVADATTFACADTIALTANDEWHPLAQRLATPADGSHLAFRLSSEDGAARLWIDDLCIDNCRAHSIRTTLIDSTSLSIEWEGDATALIATLQSGGSGRTDTLWQSPALINGLTPGGSYSCHISALCACGIVGTARYTGNGSSGNANQRSTTVSINMRYGTTTLPYCQSFEGIGTGTTPYRWRTNGATVSDRNSSTGGHSLRLQNNGWAVLPPMGNVQSLTLTAEAYANHESLRRGIVVGVVSDPDSLHTFIPTDTLHIDDLGTWQPVVASMAAYDGTGGYIALHATGTAGEAYIDQLMVGSCAIHSAAIDASGHLSWQGADSVEVEYGPAGFERGSGSTDTLGDHGGILPITGEAADVYLTALCVDAACMPLRLAIGNSTHTPYCEPLTAVALGSMPRGWLIARTYGGTPSMSQGSGEITHLLLRAAAGERSIAALPTLAEDDINAHSLSMRLRSPNAARARLLVGTIDAGADPNTFTPTDTLQASASNAWQRFSVSLAHIGNNRLAIACEATAQTAELQIDSLSIVRGMQPEVQAISARSVSISGTGGYNIDYAPLGTPQGEGITIYISDSTATINGLQLATAYRFYASAPGESTCLPPLVLTMPNEVSLPYCHEAEIGDAIVLPEAAAESVAQLHLYYSLAAGTAEVGIIERGGDWTTFTPLDTLQPGTEGHLALSAYDGEGRFVALRTIGSTPIRTDYLRLLPCELPEVQLLTDNRLVTTGSGRVLYGLWGGETELLATLTAPDTVQLLDNTAYAINLLCADMESSCAPPLHLTTHQDHCLLPDSLSVSMPGGGLTTLEWDTTYNPFYIEYAPLGTTAAQHTIVAAPQSGSLSLSLLADTVYEVRLHCDSTIDGTRQPQRLRTASAATPVPFCTTYSDQPNGRLSIGAGQPLAILPQPQIDSLRHLAVAFRARSANGTHSVGLGTMSDAANAQTFDLQHTFALGSNWQLCFHALTDYYGNGRFLALRAEDGSEIEVDELTITDCAAYGFAMTDRQADRATIEWGAVGNPQIIVEYGEQGFEAGSGVQQVFGSSPAQIEGLSALTNYTFYVRQACADACTEGFAQPYSALRDTFYTFTPQGGTGCIDHTDLKAAYVTCSYGSYTNPTEAQGAIDHGYQSAESRHTIHFDTAERDARTGGLLRTIPLGEQASVRLGNWTSAGTAQPEAESITYAMSVDADEADLLLLRYAAVLQDPEHDPSLQPRFSLEILNQNWELTDSCGMADFIANAALGWHQAANEVLWKDWTTVGIDLTPYDGQTIFVRLTTHDCGEGSHFGYAYFTLRCAAKRMATEGCSTVPDNRFTAPDGFRYEWYSSLDPQNVISTDASILVASDNAVTYTCNLSFIDNPTCTFSMSAFAGARYPLALMDTTLLVANCEFDLTLTNRSTISADGLTPVGTGEGVESLLWLLPDSNTATSSSVQLHIADTGLVRVGLMAGIANNSCVDTLWREIAILYPHEAATIVGNDERCINHAPDTLHVQHAATYSWLPSGVQAPAVLAPTADTTLSCLATDSNGCTYTLQHTLRVHPIHLTEMADSVCSSSGSYAWQDTTLLFARTESHASASRMLANQYGCDSLLTLSLALLPSYTPNLVDTICDNQSRLFFGQNLTDAGLYTHADTTAAGCDSTTTLTLAVVPRRWSIDEIEACDSLRWIDGNLYLADTLGPTDTLLTIHGCDSVVTLSLSVYPSHRAFSTDTACAYSPYYWRSYTVPPNNELTTTETLLLSDTLPTTHGCDSLLTMQLTRLPLLHATIATERLCAERMYRLSTETDAPYWYWQMADSAIHEPSILVQPTTHTAYTLTAAYDSTLLCAVQEGLFLAPFSHPEARLRVAPSTLTPTNLDFEARDIGLSYDGGRHWIYNGELLASTERVLHLQASPTDDTVGILLIVSDGYCADSALALLPVEHSALALPNAFTPEQAENATFSVSTHNIATLEINIYNRRGVLVFSSSDPAFAWDGRNLVGESCPSGAYVYYITYSTIYNPRSKQKQVGSVMLIR